MTATVIHCFSGSAYETKTGFYLQFFPNNSISISTIRHTTDVELKETVYKSESTSVRHFSCICAALLNVPDITIQQNGMI